MSDKFWACPQCGAKIGVDYTECSLCGWGKPEQRPRKQSQEERERQNFNKSVRNFRLDTLKEMRYSVSRSRSPYRKQPSGFHIVR
jgi:ribosomal protein L37E